jgi:hypothetical protein
MSISILERPNAVSIAHVVIDLHFRKQNSPLSAETPADVPTAVTGCT